MNCQEALELMGEHADDDLGIRDRWRLRLHLWICRICRRYFLSYMVTIRVAKSARIESPVDEDNRVPDALIASILDTRRHP